MKAHRNLLCLLPAVFVFAAQTSAAPLNLADQLLLVPGDMPPNLVLTLDDSGSMQWGYSPDTVCTDNANLNTRRYRSVVYNSQYYDPAQTYTPPPGISGTTLTTAYTAAYVNGFDTGKGTVNLSNGYMATAAFNPALAYPGAYTFNNACGGSGTGMLWARHPASDFTGTGATTTNSQAYYYAFRSTCSASVPADVANENCYQRVFVSATSGTTYQTISGVAAAFTDERQNFANWYSFYRTRNLATISGILRAMKTLDPKTRVAWQALNTCTSFGTDCDGWGNPGLNVENRIRTFDNAHWQRFYNWVTRLPANSGTPLRPALQRAGTYYTTSGVSSPYADDPQVNAGAEYECRQNYSLLMTDGVWNGGGSTVGNADNTAVGDLPDDSSIGYTPAAPYMGATSDTVADVAFYYWKTDLRTDKLNKVVPYIVEKSSDALTQYWNPKNDPATWQHMTTFTVGLGLTRGLAVSGLVWDKVAGTYGGSYANLASGATAWPAPAADSNNNVSDLWHAAINSRGMFFSADKPSELVDAFQKIIDRVQEKSGTAAAVSVNAPQFAGANTKVYIPSYTPNEWTGDLRKVATDADGNLPGKDSAGLYVYTGGWSAAAGLKTPDFSTRNIITTKNGAAIPFTAAGLVDLSFLKVDAADTLANDRLDWLRGKDVTGMRARPDSKLGDIVNSTPVRIGTPGGAPVDNDYIEFIRNNCTPLPDGSILTGCKATRTAALLVGANDGMLHAFRDTDGAELFAFVPEAVHNRLKYLTQVGYSHKYYVDGSPKVADAKLSGTWKTVAAGGLNVGGRGIYALDVTNPASFGPTNVIWEFNSTGTGNNGSTDLGYTFGQPRIVKTAAKDSSGNNRWAVVFGNGYNSTSERAFLFIKFLDGAKEVIKLATDTTTSNGLSEPAVFDADGDAIIEYVYAGDLQGRLWKFDLRGNNTSAWNTVGSLFRATASAGGTAQPITSAPAIVPHAQGGRLVVFGTGRMLESGDTVTPLVAGVYVLQTMYGVWDNQGVSGATFPGTPRTRSQLQVQTISQFSDTGGLFRSLTNNTVSWWTGSSGVYGWYIDLPSTGERILGAPRIIGDFALFASVIPPVSSCDQSGTSWLMAFDVRTGSPSVVTVLDTNGDGKVDSTDQNASGATSSSTIGGQPAVQTGANGQLTVYTPDPKKLKLSGQQGRMNWHDIVQ